MSFSKKQKENIRKLASWLSSKNEITYNADYWNQHPLFLAAVDGVEFNCDICDSSQEYVEEAIGLGYINNGVESAFAFHRQWPFSSSQMVKRLNMIIENGSISHSEFSYSDTY